MARILVPLDGSPFAERILGTVEQFAGLMNAEVIMLQIVELSHGPHQAIETPDQAEQYLRKLGDRISSSNQVRVRQSGTAAQGILQAISEEQVDLVMMSSHGSSGARELPLGSVASDLIHTCPVPVVILGLSAGS